MKTLYGLLLIVKDAITSTSFISKETKKKLNKDFIPGFLLSLIAVGIVTIIMNFSIALGIILVFIALCFSIFIGFGIIFSEGMILGGISLLLYIPMMYFIINSNLKTETVLEKQKVFISKNTKVLKYKDISYDIDTKYRDDKDHDIKIKKSTFMSNTEHDIYIYDHTTKEQKEKEIIEIK